MQSLHEENPVMSNEANANVSVEAATALQTLRATRNLDNVSSSVPRYPRRDPLSIAHVHDHGHDHSQPDDELPAYTHNELPTYIERPPSPLNTTPVMTYHLRQQSRTNQILVPFGPSQPSLSFRIVTRAGMKLFSKKKSDICVIRTTRSRTNSIASNSSSGSDSDTAVEVAWINFENDGKLPWMPRARSTITDKNNHKKDLPMSARNFRDWTISIDDTNYIWFVLERPTCLELHKSDLSSHNPVARFTHTRLGSRASGGAEVGTLDIFKWFELPDGPDLTTVVGTCALVMEHFRRMGKHLWAYGSMSIEDRPSNITTNSGSGQAESIISNAVQQRTMSAATI
jgi:hypothetical protein